MWKKSMSAGPLKLPQGFERRLQQGRANFNLHNLDPRQIAGHVKSLSDFYRENPGAPTPWLEDWAPAAYLSYFLPLNFVRLQSAFREVTRFLPWTDIDEVWDFGSGAGTGQWVLENESVEPRTFYCV